MTPSKNFITSLVLIIWATFSCQVLLAQNDTSTKPPIDIETLKAMCDKLADEREKIAHLYKAINKALDTCQGNVSYLGTNIKKYAPIGAGIMAIGFTIAILIAIARTRQKTYNYTYPYTYPFDHEPYRQLPDSEGHAILGTATMLFFGLWLTGYIIGNKLEDRPRLCKNALTIIMRHVDKHASSLPEATQEIFSKLREDFDKGTGTFKTLDGQRAQEIVDTMLDLYNTFTQK